MGREDRVQRARYRWIDNDARVASAFARTKRGEKKDEDVVSFVSRVEENS